MEDHLQQLRAREFEIQTLHEIGMATVSDLSLSALLQLMADKVRVLIGAKTLLIPMLDEAHENYTYVAASGENAEDIVDSTFSIAIGMCGWVLEHERPLLYGDSEQWPITDKTPWEEGQDSALLVPLFVGKRIIGGIAGTGKIGKASFTERDMELLQLVSSQISLAIEHARMFDELKNMVNTLESKVQERTMELQVANQELEAFSYSVSHDLRAPLRSIDGFSNALLEDYSDKLDAEGVGYLERLKANATRMGQLIDAMLMLSRVSRSTLNKSPIDISAMAKELAGKLAQVEPARVVEFEIEPDLQTQGDPSLVDILLTNLISNAWKYTGKTEKAKIRLYKSQHVDAPCFCVSDNGAGFNMERMGKLFQPFQRLHSAKDFEGTGIGLATVKRVINRHGGWIKVEASVGQGATFYFSLGHD